MHVRSPFACCLAPLARIPPLSVRLLCGCGGVYAYVVERRCATSFLEGATRRGCFALLMLTPIVAPFISAAGAGQRLSVQAELWVPAAGARHRRESVLLERHGRLRQRVGADPKREMHLPNSHGAVNGRLVSVRACACVRAAGPKTTG